MEKSEDLTITS